MAQQELFPRSSVMTKLPTYRSPSGAPMPEAEQEAYREKVREVVFGVWTNFRRPASLAEIYWGVRDQETGRVLLAGVRARVQQLIKDGYWPFAGFPRSKRSVDRRANEVATSKYYADGIPKIIAVTAGYYAPNPQLFQERRLEEKANAPKMA